MGLTVILIKRSGGIKEGTVEEEINSKIRKKEREYFDSMFQRVILKPRDADYLDHRRQNNGT